MGAVLEVRVGDITKLEVDAIVNAANESLMGGGGVDGAIHHAAGPGLKEECRTLDGCPTGSCKMTGGHDLPAGRVIHCVGPVWHGGGGEDDKLAGCYRTAINLAAGKRLATIAFPSISTGAYRFPKDRAARIAVATVTEALADAPSIGRVIFCCFSEEDAATYRDVLGGEEKHVP